MAISWDQLQKRYEELSSLLSQPELESGKRHLLQKEFSHLSQILAKHREITDFELQNSPN